MRLLLLFVLPMLLLTAATVAIVLLAIEPQPAVAQRQAPSADDITRSRDLVNQLRASLEMPEQISRITASEGELNSLMAFAGGGIPRLAGRVDVLPAGVVSAATFTLPHNPLGNYVNLGFGIAPSQNGLRVAYAKLGRLTIPGPASEFLLSFLLDRALGSGEGRALIGSIEAVDLNGSLVTVSLRPPAGVKALVQDRFQELTAIADPERVRVYYLKVAELDRSRRGQRSEVSFAEYLGPVFELARERSRNGDAAEENRAAILALAMAFGDGRFQRLIGEVSTGVLADYRPSVSNVGLRGRHDLVQHFALSAGLTVAAGRQLATAAGVLKEIEDSGIGGSGFSFPDLAADLAGIRFARLAVGSRAAAMQARVAGRPDERAFFPDIADLPEFLTEAEFIERYGGVGSPDYNAKVAEIERRIDALPAYRTE